MADIIIVQAHALSMDDARAVLGVDDGVTLLELLHVCSSSERSFQAKASLRTRQR